MKLYSRYIYQELVVSIMLMMLGLLALFAFFDLIQELEDLGRGDYGIPQVLLFVLLSVPGHVYEVVPLAVLIGSLYALAQLGRNSELVVLRVSGISLTKLGKPLLGVGLMFALITFLGGELVAPMSERVAQRMRIKATNSVVAQDFRSGMWVKDGNSFINVEDVLPDARLLNIHIYEFDSDFKLRAVSNAKTAHYKHGHWELGEVNQTNFADQKITSEYFDKAKWQSVIEPGLLSMLLVVPEKMSVWNLYFYIGHLRDNHQKTTRYEIALWAKLAYPIACVVMVVLALPFGFLQQRSGGISAKIFAGIMLGITYQVLNRLFVHLGLLNDWPPIFSATVPTLLFLVAGVVMLAWTERH